MPSDAPITPLTPDEVWSRLDPLRPSLDADPARHGLSDLPYAQLDGPGFERLCYELLVAEGATPRFFGRRGQKDFEVDIIVDRPEPSTLYQCKNLSEPPSWSQVREVVKRFEQQWLGAADLPPPKTFVYCCPHLLDDKALGEDWSRFHKAFQARAKVSIDFRDKHYLDTRLRRAPDLVAGLFSPSYAEHFCGQDHWISRIYYATLSVGGDLARLADGVQRRRSLPGLFFLDDCHRDPVLTGHLLDRLHPLLNDPAGRIRLVLCQRDVCDGPEDDETHPWLAELVERDCVLTLRRDLARFRAIVEHRRKDLVGPSNERLERLTTRPATTCCCSTRPWRPSTARRTWTSRGPSPSTAASASATSSPP